MINHFSYHSLFPIRKNVIIDLRWSRVNRRLRGLNLWKVTQCMTCISSDDSFFGFPDTNPIRLLRWQTKKEINLSLHLPLNALPFSCVSHSRSYPTCTAGICWRRAAAVGELYAACWCVTRTSSRGNKHKRNSDLSAVWLESVMWMLSWQSRRSRNQLHIVSDTVSDFIWRSFTDYVAIAMYVTIKVLTRHLQISKTSHKSPSHPYKACPR